MKARFIGALLLVSACGSSEASPAAPAAAASGAEPASEQEAEAHAEVPLDPSAPPNVELKVDGEEDMKSLVLRAHEDVRLQRRVRVQRRDGDAWTDAGRYHLAPACDVSSECVELAAGAELSAPPIDGEGKQCGDESLPSGSLRFVVESCVDSEHRPHQVFLAFERP